MAQVDNADNPRAVPGNNGPPDIISDVWSVYRSVSEWMEGAPGVVSRMWWKLPSSGLRSCNVGFSQAAMSRDIGTRG